jgi:HK97 family phage prohead protease
MRVKVEIRADNSVHIEGYVNVAERESRAVVTPYGKVNELIEQGVFQRAIDSAEEIELMVDHDRVIGSTKDNLSLSEDAIGLRADLTTTDEEVVADAKAGKIKGWSFGFRKPVDKLEQRADKLPLRRISGLILDEVSLIINKNPVYSATSVEVRADDEEDVTETRAYTETTVEVVDRVTETTYDDGTQYVDTRHTETVQTHASIPVDYAAYEKRLAAVKRS